MIKIPPLSKWSVNKIWIYLLLLFFGFVGNYFSFPLFFGVDFLFGSIASLVVLSTYGLGWGILSAMIVSGYTYYLWGHPYAIIIFTAEVLVVGILLLKPRRSLLQCAGIFWIFIGMPIVFFFYKVVMHMDIVATSLIMLKQCVNGICNALIASLIINLLPIDKFFKTGDQFKTIPLREVLFNLMVALVFIPVLVVMVLEGRAVMRRTESNIATNIENLSVDVSWHMRSWLQQHLHAVTELASLAGQTELTITEDLQTGTEKIKKLFPDFHNMYVADSKGTTIAFYPAFNEKGESTLGLNFSDRDYFKKLSATHQPVVSEVFLGRGGVFSPIVTLSAPVLKNDRFLGFALGALDLERIQRIIELYGKEGQYKLTLTDSDEYVIASNVPERKFLTVFSRRQFGALNFYNDSFYKWLPPDENLPAMIRFKKSFYGNERFISDDLKWKLIVEYPVALQQNYLYTLYIRYLCIILILASITFLLVFVISKRLARPITELAALTAHVPDTNKLPVKKAGALPDSSVTELHSLVTNFESMNYTLERNFVELQKRSDESQKINKELKVKIKELEAAKEALRESEEKALSLLNAITETVILVDDKGAILAVNQVVAQRLGKGQDELIGRCLYDLLPSPLDNTRKKEIEKVIRTGQPVRTEGEYNERIYDTNCYPVFTSRGQVYKVAIFSSDITEKRLLEVRLQRVQKMEAIGTLAGGVAHDLNNILSGLVSYPELLMLDIPQDSPLREPILTIKNSGEKAAAVVQDLLTLARRGVAVTEVVNLNTLIREYLKSPEHEKLKSFHPKIQIETDLDENILNIMGSPIHLSKTVMNLISNAAEAMPLGGKILISTENKYIDIPVKGYDEVQEGDYAVLSCRDFGIGISPEDTERIFEPFYTKKIMGRSGTGLGMAVVWGTIKDHKGYIDVRSIVGKGTSFRLFFPVTRKELSAEKSQIPIEDYLGNGESILIVDDVKEQRAIASGMLERLGYFVTSVSSGEEAVDFMQDNFMDLIVLDMIMDPGIDGLETYKRILELHPGQRTIITSGYSETQRVKETQRLGAGQYVKKPYTLEKIGMAVKIELKKDLR
jgi:PAS domain S-box-containing protein